MAHWAGLLFILWAPQKKLTSQLTHNLHAGSLFILLSRNTKLSLGRQSTKKKKTEPYCIYYIYNFNRQPQLCFRSDYDTIFVYERHWHFFKILVNRFSLVFSISFSDRFRRSSTNSFRIYTMSSSANLCKF